MDLVPYKDSQSLAPNYCWVVESKFKPVSKFKYFCDPMDDNCDHA